MTRSNLLEKTLKEKFDEAIEYIECNENTLVTFYGMHISVIAKTTDEVLMQQIVDIVDALKLTNDLKKEKKVIEKSNSVYTRKRKIVYNEEM